MLAEGLAAATSPGRLQIVANEPTILVDAAHNPHGARALAKAIDDYFQFGRVVAVLSVLADKDAAGIVRALLGHGRPVRRHAAAAPTARSTPTSSPRSRSASSGADRVVVETDLVAALRTARDLADEAEGDEPGGVVVTGSITLVGDVHRPLAGRGRALVTEAPAS